ncbi:transcriptional regulator, TetR family [Brevibacterium mcbrellneri ATCC 49030]|uniref:Transcriptional regulator, TetR family n=1 Tax=Brevibacterium mcbrellneri ATCC 49030 TaxID=585530 RepID=D4YLD9_9MICO|nr:TetR/AcrR family transcriptional regulator [Brevibacterium mcbrellneri]EFG47973.1 transcriptional regulator, TetR family [Brevibacterium mcbrellneri ATCC 49030]
MKGVVPVTDRREEIIQAAIELAQKEGPKAATVRAVAQHVGIGASTLRYYFPTQSDLGRAVAERLISSATPDLNIRDSSRPPHERLAECMIQFLPPSDQSVDVMVSAWVAQMARLLDPQSGEGPAQMLSRLYEVGLGRITGWLQVLADEGHIDEEDIPRAVSLLSASCDGLMFQLGAKKLSLDEAKDHVTWLSATVLQRANN